MVSQQADLLPVADEQAEDRDVAAEDNAVDLNATGVGLPLVV